MNETSVLHRIQGLPWERIATVYARIALGAAFLSAVAGRFGVWRGQIRPELSANFMKHTAELNSFMPAAAIPFLAWAATAAEVSLGVALVFGVWPRRVAFGAAGLLALFGTTMLIAEGPKSPLDYSVFSASAGALLLGLRGSGRGASRSADVPL